MPLSTTSKEVKIKKEGGIGLKKKGKISKKMKTSRDNRADRLNLVGEI